MTLKEYIEVEQKYIYRQTDLYILLMFWKEPEMERSRIIQKTGYPTETVQTCLARMYKEGILDRRAPEEGRYIYWLTEQALKLKENEYNIAYFMYKKYVSLMRPNSALLIFTLIVNGSFNIDTLIDKGYKKSAIYKASVRLKEFNIIEKKDGYYKFKDRFLDDVHAYSQIPISKSMMELYKGKYQEIMSLVANSAGYEGAINNLKLFYNVDEEQANEIMNFRIGDLV